MYIFLIVVHVFVCLVLILVVLLQAGRGGGMSGMIGAGQPQSLFGTQTNAFMTRMTEVCAVIFIITSLSLGIMSTQRGKSLVDRDRAIHDLTEMAKPVAALPVTKDPLQVNAAQVPPPTTPEVKKVLDASAEKK
jgi:preprotein translocase subunit SecG